MKYLAQFLATGLVILLISQNFPGITVENGYTSALVFAVILAVVNLILGSVLRIITFPLRLITLGAFSFVILLAVIYVTDQLVPGVTLTGIVPHVIIALATSVISLIFKMLK